MKRIRLLVLAGILAVALPFGLATANATGGGGSTSVYIEEKADFEFTGSQLDVGLQIRCNDSSGFGTVTVTASQRYPQTPTGAFGTGTAGVVCDGQTRSVAVTIIGAVFDAGRAKATASLFEPTALKTTTANRTIIIEHV